MELPLDTVCGIDEAGRGPIAGPVTAAALILPPGFPVDKLKDSKKLTPKRRTELSRLIISSAVDYSVGWVWSHEIDRINIHNASLLAMKRAFLGLRRKPDLALADGKFTPQLAVPCRAIIKGDDIIPSIQGASILAKTIRDRWMIRYSWIETVYEFEKHKGYPTRRHAEACFRYGPSSIQRKTFTIPYRDEYAEF